MYLVVYICILVFAYFLVLVALVPSILRIRIGVKLLLVDRDLQW